MSVFLTVLLSLRSTVTRQLSWISPWLGRGLPVRIIWKVSDRAARIRAPLQQAEQTYSTHGVVNLKLEELGNRISYEYRLISRMLWLARQIHARPFYKYFQREQLSTATELARISTSLTGIFTISVCHICSTECNTRSLLRLPRVIPIDRVATTNKVRRSSTD